MAISGQINGKALTQNELYSGKYPLKWDDKGNFTVNVLINYQCGDMIEPVFRNFSVNIYGDLKLEGPDFICISNLASFSVSLCSDSDTPTGVKWEATGGGKIDNGDTNVHIGWADPSQRTDDITITATYGKLVASKNFTAIQIKSETVFTEPDSRSRTTIGVGEQVKIYCVPSDFSLDWTLETGNDVGSIDGAFGNSIIYTSAKSAQNAQIKNSHNGLDGCPFSIETIEPNGVYMEVENIVNEWKKRPKAGLDIKATIYILPITVNFSNLTFTEGEVAPVVDGYFNTPVYQNANHPATTVPMSAVGYDPLGTLLEIPDHMIISGTKFPIIEGYFIWNIPWNYHFKDIKKQFAVVEQKGEFKILSQMEFEFRLTKAGVNEPIVGDPR